MTFVKRYAMYISWSSLRQGDTRKAPIRNANQPTHYVGQMLIEKEEHNVCDYAKTELIW